MPPAPQRHDHDLALHAEVGIAAVVAEDHAPLPLLGAERADELVVLDLDLGRPQLGLDARKRQAVEDVPALSAPLRATSPARARW
jgi:hypothetical protein